MSSETERPMNGSEPEKAVRTVGNFTIERKLGQGGMGTVYLARHNLLKKLVALKLLPRDKAMNPTLVRRFKAEAQAAAQLEHPNIVAVYDSGEADGYLYIAMEYVEGLDLFEYLKKRNRLPVKRSIEIIKQVASALQHAYEQNIVHRDIKPSNLLLKRDGTVKVTDLGLARSIDDTIETNITRAGTTVGTVDYMAPEQARNSKSADIRSDIYSLGCTWYQMLTGQPPYPEGSLTNKLTFHSIKPLPDPRSLNDQVPEGVLAILNRMTAKKPEDRYQTPADLLEDISRSTLSKNAFSREIFEDLDEERGISGRKHDPDEDDSSDDDILSDVRSLDEDDDDDDEDVPVRKKSVPKSRVDEEDDLEDDGEPYVRKRKRHRSDEEESDRDEPNRSSRSKKKHAVSEDEESEESTPQKRKRRVQEESDEEVPRAKGAKQVSSKPTSDGKLVRPGAKPLPPKREAIVPVVEKHALFNADSAKGFAFIAGIAAVVCGIGWLIFRNEPQSNRDDSSTQKITMPPRDAAPKIDPVKSPETPEPSPAAPTTVDRPIVDFDITKQQLPAWATSESPPPSDLPKFTVGPGLNSTGHFSEIDDALKAAEKTGGVIRLTGTGPFFLTSHELRDAKKLFIMSAKDEDRPLVILRPDESSVAGLAVANCELTLRNVHFVFNQPANSNHPLSSLVSVTDGGLIAQRCSFTALGVEGSQLAAIDFNSQVDTSTKSAIDSQILLDRVMVRGNGLSALRIHRTTVDAIIQDSLLATGVAPAISLSGQFLGGLADLTYAIPRRMIRVFRSTVSVRKLVLDLTIEPPAKPPTTAIYFADSVCSVEGMNSETTLVSALKWPAVPTNPTASSNTGWLTNLSWASTSTLYTGFEQLLEMKSSFKVDAESWQRVMGPGKMDPYQFQSIVWPEIALPNLGAAVPADFDVAKLPYRDIKTASGGSPGCPTGKIDVPDVISQERLFAMSQRRAIPGAVNRPSEMPYSKKVNAIKEDLGQIINKGDWVSGTVFEVSGSGIRNMTPARIVDKSCRIIFYQDDGAKQFIVQPRIDPKSKADVPAMISIENGTLELQSAKIEAPVPRTASPWLISATNANVIIRGCELSGPQSQDSELHPGLIRWSTTAGSQSSKTAAEQPFLAITDSVLVSTGIGIQAECARGTVFVRNSIMGIRGEGIRLRPYRSESPFSLNLDLENVTVSASKSAIQIDEFSGEGAVQSPVRLFVDESAFIAPLTFKEGESAEASVVSFSGAPLDRKLVQWWGNSNGIANEIRTWLRQPGLNPISDLPGWQAAWGESSDVRLLSGPKGVDLLKVLPARWNLLKTSSFVLDPDSPSATWAEGRRPIGADLASLEAAIAQKRYSKSNNPNAGTTKKGAPSKPPTSNTSGF